MLNNGQYRFHNGNGDPVPMRRRPNAAKMCVWLKMRNRGGELRKMYRNKECDQSKMARVICDRPCAPGQAGPPN